MNIKSPVMLPGLIIIGCIALVIAFFIQLLGLRDTDKSLSSLTPWQCVGGCGAGGAGGTAADVKWIGQGQTGGSSTPRS